MSKSLGDGSKTRFWTDTWCDVIPLAGKFPRLAALDTNSNCMVSDRVSKTSHGLVFSWNWRRPIKDGRNRLKLPTFAAYAMPHPLILEAKGGIGGSIIPDASRLHRYEKPLMI